MKKNLSLLPALLALCLCSCTSQQNNASVTLANIPAYSGSAYVELDGNTPSFTDKEKSSTKSFEKYSRLDKLGRCGAAFANVSRDTMPTEKRTSISSVKPTGWVQNKYYFIKDGMLYNRCHLIAHQLTAENANERNLITGTRYMNVSGMLHFETVVGEYVRSTGNHVLYRVTPIFDGNNLLASGVEMEAWSIEDGGRGVCFDVYCYNVQPGVAITYASGKNHADGTISGRTSTTGNKSKTVTRKSSAASVYILNTKSMKFHRSDCRAVSTINPGNKSKFSGKRKNLIARGYEPCEMCKP